MNRRRGFAMITAIAVVAVLGLIVAGLSASINAQRDVSQQVIKRGEERLALQWVVERLAFDDDLPTNTWGDVTIDTVVNDLDAESPIYAHPALTHRSGDRLALITLNDQTRAVLLRAGSPQTHHVLPREFAATVTPQEEPTL